ncbi:hypothetical protein FB45DRAFT_168579 [Roridomyces roridus]|uniref:Uncharacterized protein n=1 Tax=Roridomyces roridus TaxID=1738132 RepID=A0AAD7FE15_9AGAR|nr:hypothetical protein FB45DRAFT_168579 [Roridomyces roridus]
MNKLRKANHSSPKSTPWSPSSSVAENAVAVRPPLQTHGQPMSATLRAALQIQPNVTASAIAPRNSEQYWAARALSAETLLAARVEHHQELRSLSYEEEAKRARDVAAHDARYARLEKLVLALLATILLLVIALLNLAHHKAAAHQQQSKHPAHFTIPILSPFTSVVEHETSVNGAKTLTALALMCAVLAYFVFRHWLAIGARRRS